MLLNLVSEILGFSLVLVFLKLLSLHPSPTLPAMAWGGVLVMLCYSLVRYFFIFFTPSSFLIPAQGGDQGWVVDAHAWRAMASTDTQDYFCISKIDQYFRVISILPILFPNLDKEIFCGRSTNLN